MNTTGTPKKDQTEHTCHKNNLAYFSRNVNNE